MAADTAEPVLAARHAVVLALRAAGVALLQPCPRRQVMEVLVRIEHDGSARYRRPGCGGPWSRTDPDAADVQRSTRRYLKGLGKLLRLVRLQAARGARAERQAAAKALRDAAIVDAYEALGRALCPRPERDRAGIVAGQLGCSSRHVRNVMVDWRKKSGTH